METNWAAEHLQVIRTLMERSAVYRRALAPIMIYNGVLGIAGTAVGALCHLGSTRAFVIFWAIVAAVALTGSFILVRRQALRDSEPLWSPPTRRVAHAMLPGLAVGALAGALMLRDQGSEGAGVISIIWCIAYGCALHAAGFFMPRGIRLLGWLFILGGVGLTLAVMLTTRDGKTGGHGSPFDFLLFDTRGLFMGLMFGGLHLAYGVYLYFTEKCGNET
jgi:hypothetical protein